MVTTGRVVLGPKTASVDAATETAAEERLQHARRLGAVAAELDQRWTPQSERTAPAHVYEREIMPVKQQVRALDREQLEAYDEAYAETLQRLGVAGGKGGEAALGELHVRRLWAAADLLGDANGQATSSEMLRVVEQLAASDSFDPGYVAQLRARAEQLAQSGAVVDTLAPELRRLDEPMRRLALEIDAHWGNADGKVGLEELDRVARYYLAALPLFFHDGKRLLELTKLLGFAGEEAAAATPNVLELRLALQRLGKDGEEMAKAMAPLRATFDAAIRKADILGAPELLRDAYSHSPRWHSLSILEHSAAAVASIQSLYDWLHERCAADPALKERTGGDWRHAAAVMLVHDIGKVLSREVWHTGQGKTYSFARHAREGGDFAEHRGLPAEVCEQIRNHETLRKADVDEFIRLGEGDPVRLTRMLIVYIADQLAKGVTPSQLKSFAQNEAKVRAVCVYIAGDEARGQALADGLLAQAVRFRREWFAPGDWASQVQLALGDDTIHFLETRRVHPLGRPSAAELTVETSDWPVLELSSTRPQELGRDIKTHLEAALKDTGLTVDASGGLHAAATVYDSKGVPVGSFQIFADTDRFADEMMARARLAGSRLEHAASYSLLHLAQVKLPDGTTRFAMLTEAFRGPSVADELTALGAAQDPQARAVLLHRARQSAARMGGALAELHDRTHREERASETLRQAEAQRNRSDLRLSVRSLRESGVDLPADVELAMTRAMERAARAYCKADLPAAMLQGNPDLINFYAREADDRVAMTNLAGGMWYVGPTGRGQAEPGADYARAVGVFASRGEAAGLRREEVADLQEAFLQEYRRGFPLRNDQVKVSLAFHRPRLHVIAMRFTEQEIAAASAADDWGRVASLRREQSRNLRLLLETLEVEVPAGLSLPEPAR